MLVAEMLILWRMCGVASKDSVRNYHIKEILRTAPREEKLKAEMIWVCHEEWS